ncbi:MAG: Rho termination factor N-terminal domain-containing protein, partial [Vulcanococcus sp.]
MTQALTSLARMTLRQLRQVASELGVTLYSRKTKAELVDAIGERQADISSV